jgi:hypothetical protein
MGYYAGKGEPILSDSASGREEAVPEWGFNDFDFAVNILCNYVVGCGEEDKETALCEIRGNLQTADCSKTAN